jgi:hypothetical protein
LSRLEKLEISFVSNSLKNLRVTCKLSTFTQRMPEGRRLIKSCLTALILCLQSSDRGKATKARIDLLSIMVESILLLRLINDMTAYYAVILKYGIRLKPCCVRDAAHNVLNQHFIKRVLLFRV